MNRGLYAFAGDSATATDAACANRLDEPITNVSNMYFGLSRFPPPSVVDDRRSSRPEPDIRWSIGGTRPGPLSGPGSRRCSLAGPRLRACSAGPGWCCTGAWPPYPISGGDSWWSARGDGAG
jgi:hypothetical protein